jgi:hypothetical protein
MSTIYNDIMTIPADKRKQLLGSLDEVSDGDLDQRYRDMLNECYPVVSICGYEYDPAEALAQIDPVAYRCGFADYVGDDDGSGTIEIDGTNYEARDLENMFEGYEASLEDEDGQQEQPK